MTHGHPPTASGVTTYLKSTNWLYFQPTPVPIQSCRINALLFPMISLIQCQMSILSSSTENKQRDSRKRKPIIAKGICEYMSGDLASNHDHSLQCQVSLAKVSQLSSTPFDTSHSTSHHVSSRILCGQAVVAPSYPRSHFCNIHPHLSGRQSAVPTASSRVCATTTFLDC